MFASFLLLLEEVCDPLGDFNIWATTNPLNNTVKGHKAGETVIIAAARVSFCFYISLRKTGQNISTNNTYQRRTRVTC